MNRIIVIFMVACISQTIACQPNETDNKHIPEQTLSDRSKVQTNTKNIFDQTALFIAGKKASLYEDIQMQAYYCDYKEKLNKSWNIASASNLKNIAKWKEQNSYIKNDTLTLFYPFSGPDFLYANAFFPKASNYVMIGLENPGRLPNIKKMKEKEIDKYLQNVYNSLRYANKAGYFMTKHMQKDFSASKMNGVLHLMCMYIAKSDYSLLNIEAIQINNFGNIEKKNNFEIDDNLVNGLSFEIMSENNKIKNIYYFPLDISDNNLKDKIGFTTFISKLGKKNTFVKSASYLLHRKHFSIIRNIILKQSETIIQDDTGVPFNKLNKAGYDVKLFGNYSRTINVFKEYFQKDLFQSLEQNRIGDLFFKLGYNSWRNEMVLLLAVLSDKKTINRPVTYKVQTEGVVYKVQIKTSWKKISKDADLFKALPAVNYYYSDNLYKYTIGKFATQEACNSYLQEARSQGFDDAFVVAFYKKNRISLSKANEIMNLGN